MERVQWSSQPVTSHVQGHLTKLDSYITGCKSVVDTLGDVATTIANRDGGEGGNNPEQVEQLRGAVVQLLEARRRAQLHAGALQDLKGSYVASGEATDFAAALEQRAEAAGQLEPYSLEGDEDYRDFLAAAGGGGGDDLGADGGNEVVDDDLEIVGGAALLAPNRHCPITGKELLALQDPVEDAQEVVYEREAVLQYLRQKRGRAIINAGSNHEVTAAELKPAEKVLKAQKKAARAAALAARRGGTQQQQQQQQQHAGEEVLEI